MPTPISTSDPILAAVVDAPGVTAGFLGDVVNLINRSPGLLDEINQLDATRLADGGTAQISLQSGQNNGGNTTYHSPIINITAFASYDDMTLPYYGGSLTAGQTQYLTPAGTFVGLLGHEIGHWGDPQLGPLYTAAIAGYTIEQAVATEFASEGKAAFSQYTAMSQIQASEPAQPVPSDMSNGNILFDVTGRPIDNTGLLQHVQSIAAANPAGAASDSAIISYLGSQFWNAPVDSGTYLSTMWSGYSASGARDDLGIDESRITQFAISEAASRTLAACTIQTVAASGTALTYQIACPTPGTQQARITDSATGALVATVGTAVPSITAATQLSVVANNFSFAVIAGGVATVQGNNDTLTLGRGDSLFLNGSGSTVNGAAGNTVSLQSSSTAVIAGAGGGTINLDGNAAAVTVGGSGSAVRLFATNDAVAASGSAVTLIQSVAATLTGSNNSVAVSKQDLLTLTGNANSVSGSNAGLVLSGAQSLDLAGSQDSLDLAGAGASADTIRLSGGQDSVFGGTHGADVQLTLSGTGSMVSLTNGDATIAGGSAGTSVFGGASNIDYAGGGGILVMGSGAATVGGAGAGLRETVFGGGSGVLYRGGQEYADVIGGAGPCTIHAGSGGGWYGGGSAGGNFLAASGGGTVLDAGGNGDTLVGASGGGTFLIAAAGNETLYGGNQAGESSFFLGAGPDAVVAGPGGSVIVTGTGGAHVYGGGGHDQIWGGSGAADLFVAGSSGQLEIHGFRTGIDHLVTGKQSMTGIEHNAGGTLFTLSSGATIQLAGVETAASSAFA